MANINNFSDMKNALPKEEMDFTEDLESPVSPPASTPTSEPPILVDSLDTTNSTVGTSSGEILLPKRSQIADLLKNGPLSAAICGDSLQKGKYHVYRLNYGLLHKTIMIIVKKNLYIKTNFYQPYQHYVHNSFLQIAFTVSFNPVHLQVTLDQCNLWLFYQLLNSI